MICHPTLCPRPSVIVALARGSGRATPPPVEPPSLVVVIAVDQLRQDDLARFDGYWEHGFRRLRDGRTVLTHAPYAHLNTVTCDGTTHGTAHDDDVAAPIIFDGAGIDARRDATPASPAGLAPTLAARVSLAMPGVDDQDRIRTPVPR